MEIIDNVEANRKPAVIVAVFVGFYLYFQECGVIYKRMIPEDFITPFALFSVSMTLYASCSVKRKIINKIKFFVCSSAIYLVAASFGVLNEEVLIDSFLSIGIYYYASRYFQPDLDQIKMRPGMGSFPVGREISYSIPGLMLIWWPINRLWFFFWTPYAHLLTHRGLSHWPIIGTLTRVMYASVPFVFFDLMPLKNFENIEFWIYFLPVFVSDINHFLVDFYDSARKGDAFCSYAIPPGKISSFLYSLGIKIKI